MASITIAPSLLLGGIMGGVLNNALGSGNLRSTYGFLFGTAQGTVYTVMFNRLKSNEKNLTPKQLVCAYAIFTLISNYGVKKALEWKWEFSPPPKLQVTFFILNVAWWKSSLERRR
ncbi:MAG: hypothetical protein KFB95_04590 [Simkaniaceae bacterium]|nr:MAG: hypothetical protein KFB95_04590 [Simkaniaceae bacterium]